MCSWALLAPIRDQKTRNLKQLQWDTTLKHGMDPWPALGPIGSSGLLPEDLDCTAFTTDWLSTIALFSALPYCSTVPSQWHGQGYNSCIYCVSGSASSICPALFTLYYMSSTVSLIFNSTEKMYLFLISKATRWPGKIDSWPGIFFVFSIHLIVVTQGPLVLECLLQITHIIPTGSEIIHW